MSDTCRIVLVHGAWHGAWCFAALQHALDELGVPSLAIDLPGHGVSTAPLTDLYGDAQHVADVLALLGEPVVLVGHSYGGAVITEAAVRHADVAHLVYLTAFALDRDERVGDVLAAVPDARVALGAAIRFRDDGTSVLDHELAVPALYGDCSPAAVHAALPRLSPQPMGNFGQPVTGSPRDHVPSTYVRCTGDQAIHPAHQDLMAARCGEVVTFDCDHSPFLSRVDDTAALLARIAGGAA